MENNRKDIPTNDNKASSERSISDIVHEHLMNKDNHITDEDIRNARIDIDENELRRDNENGGGDEDQGNPVPSDEDRSQESDLITPWDVVDKNGVE